MTPFARCYDSTTAARLPPSAALGWPRWTSNRALHEQLRLPGLPARPARGVPGGARRPRRAGGDAHRLGQVALLPAAGAAARRPHGRGLAAGGVDAGPGRGARGARARGAGRAGQRPAGPGRQRRRAAARRRRRAAAALRGAGALCHPGLPRPHARLPGRPVRGRRGPLRVAVGARLPARLLPAGRRVADAGRRGDPGLDRHRHAAGCHGRGRAAAAARPACGRHGLRPPEHRLRRRPADAR